MEDGSDPPTFASPLPHALAPAYHDIVSFETVGTYSHSALLSEIIVVMNTRGRDYAGPGRGIQLGM